jgi:Tfp pilus assembly protein PilN
MIEINLLPGSGKKNRSRGAAKVDVRALMGAAISRVKDPFLVGAVAAALLSGGALAGMYLIQAAEANTIEEALQKAQQDSMKHAVLIREKKKAEAQRDSVVKQVALIRAFDDKRFIWPHIMDEVSRALPPYTWVTSLAQTNAVSANPQAIDADSLQAERVRFRLMGNTVDLQALTRFMKLLEASPFVSDVQLVKSSLIIIEGKEITEFQLDAAYETPDRAVVRTVPFTLSVR